VTTDRSVLNSFQIYAYSIIEDVEDYPMLIEVQLDPSMGGFSVPGHVRQPFLDDAV
jgi:hypothetical protein